MKTYKLYSPDELSNEDYHSTEDCYSSSQLKDALEDVEVFYKKHITKEIVQDRIPAFDIGTYFHTAILEPEKLASEVAVFKGAVRRGKKWEEFQEEHKGKAILTEKELVQAENLIAASQTSGVLKGLMRKGDAEISLCVNLEGVKIRVRCDWIDASRGFIMDLKSTTGSARNAFAIQKKISNYAYDMSAALYLDAFNEYFRQKNMKTKLSHFYWVFASKDMVNCQTYRSTPKMIELGRKKYQKALKDILEAKAGGWEFRDKVLDVDPARWEEEQWGSGDIKKGFSNNNKLKSAKLSAL